MLVFLTAWIALNPTAAPSPYVVYSRHSQKTPCLPVHEIVQPIRVTQPRLLSPPRSSSHPTTAAGVFFTSPVVGGFSNLVYISLLIFTFGPVSGGHLNPNVTIATLLRSPYLLPTHGTLRHIPKRRAPPSLASSSALPMAPVTMSWVAVAPIRAWSLWGMRS